MNRTTLRVTDRDLWARIALSVAIIVAAAFVIPGFGTQNNIAALLQVLAPIGIAALGVGVTMIAGEFDLSIGSSAVLGGVLSIRFATDGPVAALLIPVAVAVVLEVISQVRGLPAPSFPGLGGPQRAVGQLVAVAALFFVAAPTIVAAFPTPPAHAATAAPLLDERPRPA